MGVPDNEAATVVRQRQSQAYGDTRLMIAGDELIFETFCFFFAGFLFVAVVWLLVKRNFTSVITQSA